MSGISIERVLLGTLLRSGLTRDDVALLMRAARAGSTTSRRMLEDAAGAAMDIDASTVVATVSLGGGLGWRAGTLLDPTGNLPETVVEAAIGRPAGELIEHADVDPALVVRPATMRHGVLGMPLEGVALRVPLSPFAHLRAFRLRIARRRAEKSPPAWVQVSTCASLLATLALYAVWASLRDGSAPTMTLHTFVDSVVGGAMLGAVAVTAGLAVDALTGRRIGEALRRERSHREMLAHADHIGHLIELQRRRGFDEDGTPIT